MATVKAAIDAAVSMVELGRVSMPTVGIDMAQYIELVSYRDARVRELHALELEARNAEAAALRAKCDKLETERTKGKTGNRSASPVKTAFGQAVSDLPRLAELVRGTADATRAQDRAEALRLSIATRHADSPEYAGTLFVSALLVTGAEAEAADADAALWYASRPLEAGCKHPMPDACRGNFARLFLAGRPADERPLLWARAQRIYWTARLWAGIDETYRG